MVTPPQIGYGLAVVILLYFGYTPLWLYRTIIAIIFTGFGAVLPSGPPLDGSLRESMRNVTRDYDQVCSIPDTIAIPAINCMPAVSHYL